MQKLWAGAWSYCTSMCKHATHTSAAPHVMQLVLAYRAFMQRNIAVNVPLAASCFTSRHCDTSKGTKPAGRGVLTTRCGPQQPVPQQ
mmetsp:Transcript_140108/g.349146  ORF Transcript_140108/g.349146 Transcript_140108/m.349146 type:complete len:87 (+) Transcript_140108:220-480(+)